MTRKERLKEILTEAANIIAEDKMKIYETCQECGICEYGICFDTDGDGLVDICISTLCPAKGE